jgi:hypothetical protein
VAVKYIGNEIGWVLVYILSNWKQLILFPEIIEIMKSYYLVRKEIEIILEIASFSQCFSSIIGQNGSVIIKRVSECLELTATPAKHLDCQISITRLTRKLGPPPTERKSHLIGSLLNSSCLLIGRVGSGLFKCLLTNCLLTNCLFSNSLLTNCLLTNYLVTNCLLTNCLLTNCLLTNCLLTNCLFSNSLLTNCLLTYCLLTNCLLTNCLLTNCLLTNCLLTNCLLTNCLI